MVEDVLEGGWGSEETIMICRESRDKEIGGFKLRH